MTFIICHLNIIRQIVFLRDLDGSVGENPYKLSVRQLALPEYGLLLSNGDKPKVGCNRESTSQAFACEPCASLRGCVIVNSLNRFESQIGRDAHESWFVRVVRARKSTLRSSKRRLRALLSSLGSFAGYRRQPRGNTRLWPC